jgi:hypothetical protein
MKRLSALCLVPVFCLPGIALADATFQQVLEFKMNMTLPAGATQGGFPFSGPTETVARVKGTRAYSSFGQIASISDSSTNRVILLDTSGKLYATTSLDDYLDQVSKMAKPAGEMPEQARELLKNIQMKVESRETGRSEKIFGIDAAETEVLFSMTLPVPVPGGNGMEIAGKVQVWKPKPGESDRVPALREISVYYEQARKTGRDPAAMMTKMFGAVPGMGDKMAEFVSAMQKGGSVTLRLHGEVSMPGMAAMMAQAKANGANVPSIPDGPIFEFTSSLKELNTDPVPDSVFQIPEGYKEAPVADVIKAFLPGAAK